MILTKETPISEVDFLKGSTILIDKPLEWTSFDVVNKLRYTLKKELGIKKIKVGHAGTLDPLATGLLILCTGKATKTIESLQVQQKEYTGEFFLGATTPSYDRETEVDNTYDISALTANDLEAARKSFIGLIHQKPPIFSAIKKNGKALYKYARAGKEVEIPTREVNIYDFTIGEAALPIVPFKVQCSKGTYIRSLAFDYGRALNAGGYLHSLVRTKIGEYSLLDAWSLEELIKEIENSVKPLPTE